MEVEALDFGFQTKEEMCAGLRFSRSLGQVLWFEESTALCDLVFVHPQWVANIIRMVIRHNPHKVSISV